MLSLMALVSFVFGVAPTLAEEPAADAPPAEVSTENSVKKKDIGHCALNSGGYRQGQDHL